MKRWTTLASVSSAMLMAAALSAQSSSSSSQNPNPTPAPSSGSMGSTAPATMSDCANDGWKGYTSHHFKSQKSCEHYVKKHNKTKSSASGAESGTTSHTMPRTTPNPPQP